MHNPDDLYELVTDLADVPEGLPLVGALTGFADAGGAVSQLSEHFLDTLDYSTIAEFDNDILLDYRARRPTIYFDEDHLADYTPLRLGLYLAHDEVGQPFLLLTGYEPDFKWEGFTAAIIRFVENGSRSSPRRGCTPSRCRCRTLGRSVSRSAATAPSSSKPCRSGNRARRRPRTRCTSSSTGCSSSGTRSPASCCSFPHYLSDTEFPLAAVTALESVSAATGLIFPTDALRESGREFLTKIETQVEGNPELAKLVATLEERHDSYLQDNPLRSPLTDIDGELPSADSIAAELQNFLAMRRDDDSPTI